MRELGAADHQKEYMYVSRVLWCQMSPFSELLAFAQEASGPAPCIHTHTYSHRNAVLHDD